MGAPKTPLSPICLIMAGGSGTRFWPLSQKKRPKQFINLFGKDSLLQETIDRLSPLCPKENIYLLAGEQHRNHLNEQAPECPVVFEPEGKNTAACILLAALELLQKGVDPKTPLITLPADHYIAKPELLLSTLSFASEYAIKTKGLITLGILPNSPHTGYGYIQAGASLLDSPFPVSEVSQFVEKPSFEKAQTLLENGNCYWNAGIFIWTLEAISNAFKEFAPDSWKTLESGLKKNELQKAYSSLPSVPVDTAILEKAENVFTIPVDLGWSDVGSWNALFQLRNKDKDGNFIQGDGVVYTDAKDCFVQLPNGKKAALIGVDNLIVIEHEGDLLITHRDSDQKIKSLLKEIEK